MADPDVGALTRDLTIRVLPGVWPPHRDAWLLANYVADHRLALNRDVLDMFTGSGALAVSAARGGARSVTAVDVSRRALLSAYLNGMRARARVRTVRSDMFSAIAQETFDLIVANPPYVPGPTGLPTRGIARAWEGGTDGRLLIDRFLDEAPAHLRPGGRLLLVHSSMNGESETRRRLEDQGLRTEVVVRHRGRLGEVSRQRREHLIRHGLVPEDDEMEETLVVSAEWSEP